MRDGLFYQFGLLLPEPELSYDNSLHREEFRVQINDLLYPPRKGLEPNQLLVNDTAERMVLLGLKGIYAKNPANNSEGAIIQQEEGIEQICAEADLTTWDYISFTILVLSSYIRRDASMLFCLQNLGEMLKQLTAVFPKLISSVLHFYTLMELVHILRGLLREGFSIRNLRSILETLVDIKVRRELPAEGELSHLERLSLLRQAHKHYLSHKHVAYKTTIVCYLVDPSIEAKLRKTALSEEEQEKLLEAIVRTIGLQIGSTNPVIMVSTDVRSTFQKLLEKAFPDIRVMGYGELFLDYDVQMIDKITWT
ncbi:MAG: hypothetical protein GF308_00555 [Candidatus Heimdallarchaeota archaeon]|nr:hypothetical protein [Candidatus Heimdallarchaeota archaeon]